MPRKTSQHRAHGGRLRSVAVPGALLALLAVVLTVLNQQPVQDAVTRSHLPPLAEARRVGDTAPPQPVPPHPPSHDPLSQPSQSPQGGSAGVAQGRHRPGVPIRLEIPAVDVDSKVVPIDMDTSVLVPPDDPQVLGWWRGGASPGTKRGTALITGHTVHTGGGAMDALEELRRGDHIAVVSRHGRLDYRVSNVLVYSKETLAKRARSLFSQAVPARLALVTCENWNGTGYDSNVVVIALPA